MAFFRSLVIRGAISQCQWKARSHHGSFSLWMYRTILLRTRDLTKNIIVIWLCFSPYHFNPRIESPFIWKKRPNILVREMTFFLTHPCCSCCCCWLRRRPLRRPPPPPLPRLLLLLRRRRRPRLRCCPCCCCCCFRWWRASWSLRWGCASTPRIRQRCRPEGENMSVETKILAYVKSKWNIL